MLVLCLILNSIILKDTVYASSRIVGGRSASIEEFPYQLSVRYNGRPICGGAIISKDYGLSVAHCFPKSGTYSVKAGSTNVNDDDGVVVNLRTVIIHPRNSVLNNDYDIAILEFEEPLSFSSTIQPVKLPKSNEVVPVGMKGSVSGWGSISAIYTFTPDTLRAVDLPVLPKQWCQSSYMYIYLTPRMFCAGYRDGGRDSCQGDSGGPFVVNGTLYGLVSWGFNCAQPGYPGVYTNIVNLRRYIKNNTGI